MITVPAGGSSSVLRKACGDSPVIRSASSMMKTFHGPTTGHSDAVRSSARTSAMRIAFGPFGLSSGGVGTMTCRSGCAGRATPSRARANSSAAARRPDPSGPMKAYACATRREIRARASNGCSIATQDLAQALFDEGPDGLPDFFLALVARNHRDAIFFLARDLEIARAHPLVERQTHLLEGVVGAVRDPPDAHPRGEIEHQRQVRQHAFGRKQVELLDRLDVHAAAVALVRDCRIDVPV